MTSTSDTGRAQGRWRRAAVAIAVALAIAVPVTVATASTARPSTNAGAEQFRPLIDWKPCTDHPRFQVDCGDLVVPIDWSRPDGPKITLSVVRKRATDQQHRLGVIVIGPGGPGLSGVTMVKSFTQFSADVQSRYDVIGYDSRGIGESNPITCDSTGLTVPTAYPTNEQEFQQIVQFNRVYSERCRKLTGPVFDHLDTVSNARDMDALRIALGERKLNFYGASYGTMLGQTYAMLYPSRVNHWVLDSNMDHSVRTAFDFLDDETTAAEQDLTNFFHWCDQNTGCALHGTGAEQTFTGLYRAAEKAGTDKVLELVELASIQTAAPSQWRAFAEELREAAAGQSTGDPLPAWQPNPSAAIFCSDWSLPIPGFADWQQIVRRLAAASPLLRISWQAIAYSDLLDCVGSTVRTSFPQQQLNLAGAPPILIIDTEHDVRTPFVWGANAAAQGRAVNLIYDGYGHSIYFPNYHDCIDDKVDNYLLTGATPAANSHCADMETP
jgi:pimeloyl-ACP methyl ester carboxylesterase